MFEKTPIQPDPQWVVPMPLLSEEKLYDLFEATFDQSVEDDNDRRKPCKWFAERFPEFGKDWKWYWTAYLETQYGN